jgi:hypothetical protein
MNAGQKEALQNLINEQVGQSDFLRLYGIGFDDVPLEVSKLLRQAIAQRDGDGVECALLLGFSFAFPIDIVGLVNQLVSENWHTCHEDMLGILQRHHDPSSVSSIKQAIQLKPSLAYLDYDDYGSYYKKCLWALSAIGTPEAISIIEECRISDDKVLREQAEHRLSHITNRE